MTDSVQKLTPLFAMAQALGAQFADRDGWQVAEVYSSTDEEAAAARLGVTIADASASGKLLVEGEGATDLLQAVWSAPDLPVGDNFTVAGQDLDGQQVNLYRLRADRYLVSLPGGQETGALQALAARKAQGGGLVSVTDVSHGRAELWLVGPKSAELLSRLCGLDFHNSHFPNGRAGQSSVAKTNQLIIRRDLADLPRYVLIGDRSLAAYLWETIVEAGDDLGIRPIGWAALAQLRAE